MSALAAGPEAKKGTRVLVPLGAAAAEASALAARLSAGIDGVWCDVSHVSAAVHTLRAVRSASSEKGLGTLVAVACLGGRTARVGAVAGGAQELAVDGRVTFSLKATVGEGMIPLSARDLARDVTRGEVLAAGTLELEVDEVRGAELRCRVIRAGRLTSGQALHLPQTHRSTPTFHDEDRPALEAALVAGFDWIALPDVRTADDVRDLRSALRARESDAPLAAVLHPAARLSDAADLVAVIDALVIDRIALATATPPEQLLEIVDAWIAAGRAGGAVVVVTGGVMAGMATASLPGPGDLADLTRLAAASADAVVIDPAAARGPHGVEACGAALRIITATSGAQVAHGHGSRGAPVGSKPSLSAQTNTGLTPEDAFARGAVAAADAAGVNVLAVSTLTGKLAMRLARFRPGMPLLAMVPRGEVGRRLGLIHGVHVVEVAALAADEIAAAAAKWAQELGLARGGGTLAVAGGDETAPAAAPVTVTICRVESPNVTKSRKPAGSAVSGLRRP